jgi:hypothetical protein
MDRNLVRRLRPTSLFDVRGRDNHCVFSLGQTETHFRFGNSDLITVANPPNDKYEDSE